MRYIAIIFLFLCFVSCGDESSEPDNAIEIEIVIPSPLEVEMSEFDEPFEIDALFMFVTL